MFIKQLFSIRLLVLIALLCSYQTTFAMLDMELTRGVSGAIPITIAPFSGNDVVPEAMAAIITNDLQNSGRFKVSSGRADYQVTGSIRSLGGNRYQVSFSLTDGASGEQHALSLASKQYTVSASELRPAAHHISDVIYQKVTGTRGVFSTKIAYVVVSSDGGHKRYALQVADQDGYRPVTLLRSPEPIMSPTWSPNGRELAYVSFEHRMASIYVQNVATGGRTLVSHAPGINGAPAFSPDGRKLALVLSTSGTPNIYVMDLASHHLTQITNDFYINTEPAFSPNGRSLLFTSNRSGGPQIYQVNLQTHAVSRMTYDGAYNARGSYTPDGNHIIMIHSVSGIFSIGVLDLDGGTLRVLSGRSHDSASPSMAPNGSMVIYDTDLGGGHNVLGMSSIDGRVEVRLPARDGNAQDPAWSPFLS